MKNPGVFKILEQKGVMTPQRIRKAYIYDDSLLKKKKKKKKEKREKLNTRAPEKR